MKKYLKSLLAVVLTMIVIMVISKFFIGIPDFIIGWICCMVFYLTMYDIKEKI